jgi:hypothetical protein
MLACLLLRRYRREDADWFMWQYKHLKNIISDDTMLKLEHHYDHVWRSSYS